MKTRHYLFFPAISLMMVLAGLPANSEDRIQSAEDLVPFFEKYDVDPRGFSEAYLRIADMLFEKALALPEEKQARRAAKRVVQFMVSPEQYTLDSLTKKFTRYGIKLTSLERVLLQEFTESEAALRAQNIARTQENIQIINEKIARIDAENAARRRRIKNLQAKLARIREETAGIREEIEAIKRAIAAGEEVIAMLRAMKQ